MKTLVESLFNKELISKELLDDKDFKKWINRPDTLWYLYRYWSDGTDDEFEDFMPNEWDKYKQTIDAIIDQECMKIYHYSDDDTTNVDLCDIFNTTETYYTFFDSACDEIERQSTDRKGDVYKTWFKGNLPKGSNVTDFIQPIVQYYDDDSTRPGKVAGGIFLVNEDHYDLIVYIFKKNTNKDILKLFNLK